jgi:hypothetical protein
MTKTQGGISAVAATLQTAQAARAVAFDEGFFVFAVTVFFAMRGTLPQVRRCCDSTSRLFILAAMDDYSKTKPIFSPS